MNNAANTAVTFRTILQNIVCARYLDKDEAYRAIDEAFEAGAITQHEASKLEGAVEA